MTKTTKLKFDLTGLWYYIRDKYTDLFLDVRYLVLFESDYSESGFYPLAVFKYSDMLSYIEVNNASDNFIEKFYMIRLYSDFQYKQEILQLKSQFATDEAFQEHLEDYIKDKNPLDIYDLEKNYVFQIDKIFPDLITTIIDEVRTWIGDLNLEDPAFTDEQYIQMIKFALIQYKGESNLLRINEQDKFLIQLLVRESISLNLAHDYAKYYKLTAPGAELDKSEISRHYIEVARALREQYQAYSQRLNLESGGYNDQGIINRMPSFDVVNLKRKSYITGLYDDDSLLLPKSFVIKEYNAYDKNYLRKMSFNRKSFGFGKITKLKG